MFLIASHSISIVGHFPKTEYLLTRILRGIIYGVTCLRVAIQHSELVITPLRLIWLAVPPPQNLPPSKLERTLWRLSIARTLNGLSILNVAV